MAAEVHIRMEATVDHRLPTGPCLPATRATLISPTTADSILLTRWVDTRVTDMVLLTHRTACIQMARLIHPSALVCPAHPLCQETGRRAGLSALSMVLYKVVMLMRLRGV